MMKVAPRVALLMSTVAAVSVGLSAEPFPSTYQVPLTPPLLIQGATVLTGTGERIDGADVLIENGRIQSVGRNLSAPAGARIVNAAGRWVTPGIIDIHSHLGVYASPGTKGLDDGNEATSPNTANVWAEHSIWPQDPGLETALEGGVTTLQILPGSATLDAAARLARAGVRIAFSRGDGSNARLTRQLAGNAVAHGLPWESALAAITANPAEIFGLGATRGRIAVGQVADLVLWTGDPLEVTSVADRVWIAGRPIEMRSRQTELRDRYLERLKAHRAF